MDPPPSGIEGAEAAAESAPAASPPRQLVIGRIVGVYGVRGWVRIQSFTEPEENLLAYEQCSIGRGEGWTPLRLDAGHCHGRGLVAHIEGIDDREQALALKGSDIAILAQTLPALQQGEYYWHQLEGLAVHGAGALLGRVDHLMATGANDVLVVRACEGSIDQRERLIPWLPGDVVRSVDLAGGRIEVAWDPEF